MRSHMRTQSPQRIQSSSFFLNRIFSTPYSLARLIKTSSSGLRDSKSSMVIFLFFIALSESVRTFKPSVAAEVHAVTIFDPLSVNTSTAHNRHAPYDVKALL